MPSVHRPAAALTLLLAALGAPAFASASIPLPPLHPPDVRDQRELAKPTPTPKPQPRLAPSGPAHDWSVPRGESVLYAPPAAASEPIVSPPPAPSKPSTPPPAPKPPDPPSAPPGSQAPTLPAPSLAPPDPAGR